MTRRSRRWVTVGGGVVVIVVIGVLAAGGLWRSGVGACDPPVSRRGAVLLPGALSTVGAPAPVGVPLSFGSLVLGNMTDRPITISSVGVAEADPGLTVVGVTVASGQERKAIAVGVLPGYPSDNPGADYRDPPVIIDPVGGASPRGVDIVVGLQANRPGRWRARGIEVTYEWRGRQYVTTFANTLVVCADQGPLCRQDPSDGETMGA